jgi:hypothetical protein
MMVISISGRLFIYAIVIKVFVTRYCTTISIVVSLTCTEVILFSFFRTTKAQSTPRNTKTLYAFVFLSLCGSKLNHPKFSQPPASLPAIADSQFLSILISLGLSPHVLFVLFSRYTQYAPVHLLFV